MVALPCEGSTATMVAFLNTKQAFDDALAGAGLVAIDFTASWCGPCKMIGPRFEAMSTSGEFPFVSFYKAASPARLVHRLVHRHVSQLCLPG